MAKFKSLRRALARARSFNKRREDQPEDLQGWIKRAVPFWNVMTPRQRREHAKLWDLQHDPAYEPFDDLLQEHFERSFDEATKKIDSGAIRDDRKHDARLGKGPAAKPNGTVGPDSRPRQADRERQAKIHRACEQLRDQGQRFRTKKEEHAAVLQFCGVSEPLPRGWDYKTFCRLSNSN